MSAVTTDPLLAWAMCPDLFSEDCQYEETSAHPWPKNVPGAAPSATHPTGSRATPARTKEYVTLDPLREPDGPQVIGTFRLRVAWEGLKLNGFLLLASIVAVLVLEEEFKSQCEIEGTIPEKKPRMERMNPKNLSELMEDKFLVPLAPPNLRGAELQRFMSEYHAVRFSSLFTAPKSSGARRLLLNGIPGNEVLQAPPYFTFFSPACIVTRLRALGVFTGFTVDIRHCFYRLPMHRRMARYYAIAPGGPYYVPSVLPMGSTWGPALGQSTTIAMITHRVSAKESKLGVRVPQDRCPSILDIVVKGEVVGHIFICIDNVCVVARDPALVEQWWERLDRNARICGIWPFKKEARTHWTQSVFEFIGIRYEDGEWHHCDDRIKKWAKRYGDPPPSGEAGPPAPERWEPKLRGLSAEELQSLVGVLVWDRRLRVSTVKSLRAIFGVMTRALAGTLPSLDEWELLNGVWRAFLENPKQQWKDEVWPPVRKAGATLYIATDASDDKWSWVGMKEGRVVRNPSGHFPKKDENPLGVYPDADTPIYYKELFGVLMAMRALDGTAAGMVVLVGDNMGVIGSIRKRIGPEGAWEMLDEIEEIIKRNKWGLDLRWVESDGNVAHSATHDERLTMYRTSRTWQVSVEAAYSEPEGGRGKRDIDGNII